jgi:hypothetical protein
MVKVELQHCMTEVSVFMINESTRKQNLTEVKMSIYISHSLIRSINKLYLESAWLKQHTT